MARFRLIAFAVVIGLCSVLQAENASNAFDVSRASTAIRAEASSPADFDEVDLQTQCREPDEIRAGDLNGDHVVDTVDLDLLDEMRRHGQFAPQFDFNGDGIIDLKDREYWIKDIRHTNYGDSNLDGKVDNKDRQAVAMAGLYETGAPATWKTGDFNGDSRFDSSDWVVVMENSGETEKAEPVPEPLGLSLAGMGMVFLLIAYTTMRKQAISDGDSRGS